MATRPVGHRVGPSSRATAPVRGAKGQASQAHFALGTHAPGATPLDPDEAADLIPTTVVTHAELNAFEQVNILSATEWALRPSRRPSSARVLTDRYLIELHRRMFDRTWRWAGLVRRTDKNIGVHWPTVRVALRERLEDASLWLAKGLYSHEEIAVRLHHAIVVVHPFPNGNGRWSRLAADALLHALRQDPFTWGATDLTMAGDARQRYLDALRAADNGSFAALLAFARS